jgi:hypothetical protein
VHKIRDAIIDVWGLQIDAAKIQRNIGALDGREPLIDSGFMTEMFHKLRNRTLGNNRVSMRSQRNFQKRAPRTMNAHYITVTIQGGMELLT